MIAPVSPGFDAVARFARLLLTAAGGAVLLALAALVAQHALNYGALAPLAPYVLLLAIALYTSGRVARLRAEVHRTRDAEAQEGPATEPGESSTPGAWAQAKLARFGREGVAVVFSLGGAAGLGLSVVALRGELGSGPTGRITVLVGVTLGLLAFLLMVASRWTVASPRLLPESPGLAEWLRGGQWVSGLTGVGLLARGLGLEAFDLGQGIAVVLLAVCALCAAELSLRGIDHFFRSRMPGAEIAVPVQLITLITLTTLFHGGSPVHGLIEVAERRLGLSLRSTWAIGFVRRSLGALLASLILLVWASTMLVAIGPQEQGIRLRFGRLASRVPVSPGVHFKWPWPLETVQRYPVTRVQTLGLGYAGPPKGSLLWGRTHAGEEYQLLLGDGRELVSVDATVSYRIRDVLAFAFASQNPRETLDALAHRLLMRATVATDLDRLLTADRTEFGRRFAVALQQACDAEGLGLEILHVGFTSLHPPVGIASAYEDVVSAEIERETRAARGRVYQETTVPTAQAAAARMVREAEAEAARRLADAEGAAAGFRAALSAARMSPDLFRFRRRLEALEDGLADRSLFIVDYRLRTGAGELWIDLRPGAQNP